MHYVWRFNSTFHPAQQATSPLDHYGEHIDPAATIISPCATAFHRVLDWRQWMMWMLVLHASKFKKEKTIKVAALIVASLGSVASLSVAVVVAALIVASLGSVASLSVARNR